jgi:hypothetical protein
MATPFVGYFCLRRRANGLRSRTCPAGYGAGAGVDSVWEQKIEARKCLKKATESPAFSVSTLCLAFFVVNEIDSKNKFTKAMQDSNNLLGYFNSYS